MLITPAGAAFASGASVALGTAVGELALLPEAGAVGAAGVSPPVEGAGVAVAEDPQANNSATNNRTTPLVRCLETRALNAACGTYVLP